MKLFHQSETISCQTFSMKRGLSVIVFKFCTMTGIGRRQFIYLIPDGVPALAVPAPKEINWSFDQLYCLPPGRWAIITDKPGPAVQMIEKTIISLP